MISGLIIGFLLGFIIKRSRICFTGCFRDLYLEKRVAGLYVILLLILTQSLIYFALVEYQLIAPSTYPAFSLLAIALGSFIFGLGCIFSNGCVTLAIIKTGDGRIAGLMTLLSFAIFASAAKQGFLREATSSLQSIAKVNDVFVPNLSFSIFYLIIPLFLIVAFLSYRNFKNNRLKFSPSAKYTGLRHLFFEKNWSYYVAAILIGIVAGLAWYTNGQIGITGNMIGWLNIFTHSDLSDLKWGNNFILGIILGSFICCYGSLEFSLKPIDAKTVLFSLIGGLLMGIGAVIAQGCMLGNALVGTATLSLKAWCAFLFIAMGIWFGSYFFYVKPLKNSK